MKILSKYLITLSLIFVLSTINVHYSFSQETENDEFESFEQNDEFAPLEEQATDSDEFTSFENGSTENSCTATSCNGCDNNKKSKNSKLWWVLATLIATIVAGFMVRYKALRNLRGVFLLASLVVLGFYRGGCPCPIMSFQHLVFAVIGSEVNWLGMLWFLGLIPITYLFGKVWCGWICHLGALQEFLYLPGKVKVLQTEKAQKVMRIIRIVFLIALIIQIVITKTNLFKTIDPFKVAFNLRAGNTLGWILLGLLIVSSIFIYRPFCKTVCPIGLTLGWISKIPGASILAPKKECLGCKVCDASCKINAITNDGKKSKLDNQECIVCGNCITDCKKGAMSFVRMSTKYPSKSSCERKI